MNGISLPLHALPSGIHNPSGPHVKVKEYTLRENQLPGSQTKLKLSL